MCNFPMDLVKDKKTLSIRSAFIVKYSEKSSQPISDGISSVIVSGSNESFKISPILAISFGSLFTGGIS